MRFWKVLRHGVLWYWNFVILNTKTVESRQVQLRWVLCNTNYWAFWFWSSKGIHEVLSLCLFLWSFKQKLWWEFPLYDLSYHNRIVFEILLVRKSTVRLGVRNDDLNESAFFTELITKGELCGLFYVYHMESMTGKFGTYKSPINLIPLTDWYHYLWSH